MDLQSVWQEFTTLPADAQALVADFIALLKQRQERSPTSEKLRQQDLRLEPFTGTWQDREDLQGITQWVRNIRFSEWMS